MLDPGGTEFDCLLLDMVEIIKLIKDSREKFSNERKRPFCKFVLIKRHFCSSLLATFDLLISIIDFEVVDFEKSDSAENT